MVKISYIEGGFSIDTKSMRLSRSVRHLIKTANGLGIDPTPLVEKAIITAKESGKGKVGYFGEARKHLPDVGTLILNVREFERREKKKTAA